MKRIFTLLSVMLITGALSAQYYQLPFIDAGQNPGGLNQDVDQTAASMVAANIGYTQVLFTGDTDWSGPQTIPFSFEFNGTAYTSLHIAPEGLVTFTGLTGPGPGANVALPTSSIPDNSICAWGLNIGGANDGVIVKTHGTSPNRQYWMTWASASWTQGAGWAYWSIVLEETTNNIYIVDARNYVSSGSGVALTVGLQFDATTAMSVPGSPTLGATNEATGGSDVGPADNSYYAFFSGTQPDYDAAMSGLDLPSYQKIGSGLDVMATITNLGAETITDLELSYTIDGGTPVVGTVSGLSIASGASATVTHPTAWNPTTEGNFNVEYWASSINSNADENPADDKTNKDVITYTDSYPRVVFYETFTSSTCAPCVAGNANFEAIKSGIPAGEISSIKYQMSWPGAGDPYNNVDGNDRRNFYGINSVPRMEIDGGWDGNSSIFTMAEHTAALEVPAFVNLNARYQVDAASKTVTTCTQVEAMQDMPDAIFYVAIKEFETTANVGTNGETEFADVVKKMGPDANGTPITITKGMNESVCVNYTFKGSYRLPNDAGDIIDDATEHSVEDFNDLGVVVWIQNATTKEVYNSKNARNEPLSVSNLNESNTNMSVYPNPAVNTATVTINTKDASSASVKVLDLVGKTVMNMSDVNLNTGANTINLNTSNLNAGVYMIVLTSNGNVSTQQLVIKK